MSFTISKPTGWSSLPLYKKIVHYRSCLDERFAPFVDKLEAKKIVKEVCGDDIQVAKVIRILDGPDDITETDLQNTYHIIKSTHGCGWNVNITERTDLNKVKERLTKWNCHYNPEMERQYAYIQPRFFIEEQVNDIHTGLSGNAVVYMFRCIHGIPVTVGVKSGNDQDSYDLEWNLLAPRKLTFSVPKPAQLPLMIQLAKQLSKPFEFVRIDFYLSSCGQIFFSEYTFTPAGGSKLFSDELEYMLGSKWV
jgi:hypothetical protein